MAISPVSTDTASPVSMGTEREIKTAKVTVLKLFTDFWFRIPAYQRPYVWGEEQIDTLLDDLTYALNQDHQKEYFLGATVLQKHKVTQGAVSYDCYDVLDGQQRLTTLLLMMAVLRDLANVANNGHLRDAASGAIYQKANPFLGQPERGRIEFLIRDRVEEFVTTGINPLGGTDKIDTLQATKSHLSVANMAQVIRCLREKLQDMPPPQLIMFATFLFHKVIFIYVASDHLEDAFRFFTILNNRGMPLSTGDILKAINIGAVLDERRKRRYAEMWEELEEEFGRDAFDRFLNHLRTILLKEKARDNLLKEYEEKIYRQGKLTKGESTLKLVETYRKHFGHLLWQESDGQQQDVRVQNLLTIMTAELATDWIPPLLFYYERFGDNDVYTFLQRLESKVVADWILQLTPTMRLSNTYAILREIEQATSASVVIQHPQIFQYDQQPLRDALTGDIYGKSFCKYVLLKLECLLRSSHQVFPSFGRVSVEHVLPQHPEQGSQWGTDFTEDERQVWTHKLGNLVLLTRNKNAQLSNRDFAQKKQRYFASSIDVFPHVAKVMQYTEWTPHILAQRQEELLGELLQGFQ